MVVVPQPVVEAMPEYASVGWVGHVTVTVPLYQPLFPSVPEASGTPGTGTVLSDFTVRIGDANVFPALSVVITRRS